MKATFYQILGISPNAKMRQIRTSIRYMLAIATVLPFLNEEKELAAAFKTPEMASDLFCLAHHASFVLLDFRRRNHYDQCLAKNLHRQDLNQSRYRVLLQHTGGATRRFATPTFSDQVQVGADHLGVLYVGFNWSCEEYWTFVRGVCVYVILIALLGIEGFYVWKSLIYPTLSNEGFEWAGFGLKIFEGLAQLSLCVSLVFIAYKFNVRLHKLHEFTEEETIMSSMAWGMLELSEAWRRSDRIFLGEDCVHEEAAWIFRVRMSHIVRSEIGMSCRPAPFRRVWARVVDLSIWGNLCLTLIWLEFFDFPILCKQHPFLGTLIWLWFTLSTWVLIEAWLLSYFQTTLGRCVAGVTVHFRVTTCLAVKNEKVSWRTNFLTALKRSWAVWWYGMGAGILPIGIWFTAKFLEAPGLKTESVWDSHADTIVMVHPTPLVYSLIGVFLVLGFMVSWALIFFA